MTTDESSSIENVWQEIEELVMGLAQISRTEISSQRFYSELVERAIQGLGGRGALLWIPDTHRDFELIEQQGLNPETDPILGLSQEQVHRHRMLLNEALLENEPASIAAGTGLSADHQGKNPLSENLILCPVRIMRDSVASIGILEIIHSAPRSYAAQEGYLRFISALCEISEDFCQHQQLLKLQELETLWEEFERFSEHVHLHLDTQQTAYIIANEGRLLINCDRVSVLQQSGSAYRLLAASGVESIERRSESVQRLETLVNRIQALNRPYWNWEADQNYPPQITEPLHAYLDLAASRSLMIFPLKHITQESTEPVNNTRLHDQSSPTEQTIGAIVVEQFHEARAGQTFLDRSLAVARHGGTALYNALQYESFPFFPVLKFWSHSPVRKRQLTWRKLATAGVVLAVITVLLIMIPADFTIEGTGTLQPVDQQNIFATADGIVDQILVQQGDEVTQDQTLLTLRDSELELESSRVRGEIQTVQKRLAVIQAARLELNPTDADALQRANRLTAEQEELNERLKSLTEQRTLLKNQQDALLLKSPIAGEVLTWDLQEKLLARPVQRGQRLLTVAHLAGPWELKMQVPDSEVGHVLEAQRRSETSLNVSFLLLTDPDQTYTGTIQSIAATAEPDQEGTPAVQITVKLDRESIKGLRPGASVLPQIDCGQRSLGYVWLRRLWETVQREVFLF